MTEDSSPSVSSKKSTFPNNGASSQTRERKKRKWDQPAEFLVSPGIAIPGVLPMVNMLSQGGIAVPVVCPVTTANSSGPLAVNCATIPQQNTAEVVPKLKIQDELIIAREIVINDAESSVRYKLTKRHTQEEIQKCTGAVVITRGKYRPPNVLPDGEKPLYLHISAGVHLKETAERILAVDRAAAMIEEMLKQSQSLPFISLLPVNNGLGQPFSTCVFLGFDADPSLNIAARIRGPNDQYINHIMNETGAKVLLKGCGSGNIEGPHDEGGQQPLHLFLSSSNTKNLEDARCLAENLMDTIGKECGVSRVSSCQVYSAVPPPQQVYGAVPPPQPVYSAVPPPQQLLAGVQSSGNELSVCSTSFLTTSAAGSKVVPPVASFIPGVASVISHGSISLDGGLLNAAHPNVITHPPPLLSSGTSYNGYGGIYPQATPLQQVALALRQSSSTVTPVVAPTASAPSMPKLNVSSSTEEKRSRAQQRRKFQELPAGLKGSSKVHQDSEFSKSHEPSADVGVKSITADSKKLIQSSSNGMPPPPPKAMPPPPVPPKVTSVKAHDKKISLNTVTSDAVSETLIKLMEYGEEDDDPEDTDDDSPVSNSNAVPSRKPFWAL